MSLWDFIYPKKCFGCSRSGRYICDQCLEKIELSDECLNSHLSLFCYRGVMRAAVKKLKFKFLKDAKFELEKLIESGLERKLGQPNTELFRQFLELKPFVQAVPLFWYRQNWRGFNQAEIIARAVARKLKLRQCDCLERVKISPPQSSLKRPERLKNVQGIFSVKPVKFPRAVLLIDDVWTTGATMNEAMKIFKDRGVKKIWGLSLAR